MARKRPSKNRSKPKSNSNKKSVSGRARPSPSSSSTPSSPGFADPSSSSAESAESFIPRGPTMRTEYERKGLIEPSLDADAGTLPEVVANRMIRRILFFAGIPLSLLFIFFAVYFVLKYKYDISVLPGVVAFSTLGTVGLATAGISYGILSSSWDNEDGSLLGWEETKTNFMRARDGLLGARQREKDEDELDKIDQYIEELDKEKDEKDKKIDVS